MELRISSDGGLPGTPAVGRLWASPALADRLLVARVASPVPDPPRAGGVLQPETVGPGPHLFVPGGLDLFGTLDQKLRTS